MTPSPVQSLETALGQIAGVPVELNDPPTRSSARHDERRAAPCRRAATASARRRERIATEIAAVAGVAAVEDRGRGFLNLTMEDAWLAESLQSVLDAGPDVLGPLRGRRGEIRDLLSQAALRESAWMEEVRKAHGRASSRAESMRSLSGCVRLVFGSSFGYLRY